MGGGCDKGINKQSVWRVNLTKVTIIDQIDKFVPKKRVKREKKTGKEGARNFLGGEGGPTAPGSTSPLSGLIS